MKTKVSNWISHKTKKSTDDIETEPFTPSTKEEDVAVRNNVLHILSERYHSGKLLAIIRVHLVFPNSTNNANFCSGVRSDTLEIPENISDTYVTKSCKIPEFIVDLNMQNINQSNIFSNQFLDSVLKVTYRLSQKK